MEEQAAQIRQKIKETVLKILQNSNMDDTTEYAVRTMASKELQLDLSASPEHKRLVRQVVETYLSGHHSDADPKLKEDTRGSVSLKADDGEEKEEEEEPPRQKKKTSGGTKKYSDTGELIVCKLSDKRRVTIQEFKGRTLVSMREYYEKDGKQLPSKKGISLTTEQWSILKKNVPAIEKCIGKMEARLY